MLDNPVLTVAFVVTITSFFKKQLGLTGWKVLLAAFLVLAFITYVPVVVLQFPAAATWLTPLVNLVVFFLSAAGTVDFVNEVRAPIAK